MFVTLVTDNVYIHNVEWLYMPQFFEHAEIGIFMCS